MSYQEACETIDASTWRVAMAEEMGALGNSLLTSKGQEGYISYRYVDKMKQYANVNRYTSLVKDIERISMKIFSNCSYEGYSIVLAMTRQLIQSLSSQM